MKKGIFLSLLGCMVKAVLVVLNGFCVLLGLRAVLSFNLPAIRTESMILVVCLSKLVGSGSISFYRTRERLEANEWGVGELLKIDGIEQLALLHMNTLIYT